MGLDMYLCKKTYIGAKYEHRKVTGEINISSGEHKANIDFKKVTEISEIVGYWRKANHIHKWFVDNVQEGVDNCEEYYVDKDQLQKLLDLCRKVKENPELTSELLPTTNGFFFGSTEYDKWYMEDIEYTITSLEEVLKPVESIEKDSPFYVYFYYQSSW